LYNEHEKRRDPGAKSGTAVLLEGLGFGNLEQDGLVRGAEFVMIWTFLVSRGNSAADCS